MKITLKEIADQAGVSTSTVSRVINNSKPVKEELRKKVLSVLKENNYLPFVNQSTPKPPDRPLIGVICPQNTNTVLDDYVVGINRVSRLYGYDTVIGFTDGSKENEMHYMNLFIDQFSTQGLIFMGNPWEVDYHEFVTERLHPVILVGQTSLHPSIPSVHVDNFTASYEAVTYLINNGHKKIGMIKGSNGEPIWEDRFKGYKKALEDAGLSFQEKWVVESGVSLEEGSRSMSKIVKQETFPTAVFCSTDSMAIGAMNYLLDHGFKVPEDISVFGFDGIELSKLIRPRLSTIEYSAVEIGMTATRHLMKLCKNDDDSIPQHLNVMHHLALRESTCSLN